MKYLGIDFGTKKVGVANSVDDGRLAFPMMICPNNKTLMPDIMEIIRSMRIEVIVIGESLDGSGKPNPVARLARKFAIDLENEIGDLHERLAQNKNNSKASQLADIKIVFEKEWYSSVEARRIDGEKNVDDRAAAIILQRYLDRVNGPIDDINTDEEESDEE